MHDAQRSVSYHPISSVSAPLVNQGCKVFMLHRSQRKNGEEKFFVRWSRRCRAVKIAATHISRSQCHNIAAATLVHRTLTFEPPAPSCLWDLRADHQGHLVPSSTPSCRWGSAGAESYWEAQDRQVTTLSLSQLAARQQQRGQFEAAAATWGKAIIQRSAIIRRWERQKREKIDVLSSLQQ